MILAADGADRTMGGWRRPIIALMMICISDFLIYSSHIGSISIVILFISLSVSVIACNQVTSSWRVISMASAVMAVSLFPIIYEVGTWQILIGFCGVAYFARSVTFPPGKTGSSIIIFPHRFYMLGWRGFGDDFVGFVNFAANKFRYSNANAAIWLLPIAMTFIFIFLLSVANPLIAYFFICIENVLIRGDVDVFRIIFWMLTPIAIWPFIHVRECSYRSSDTEAVAPSPDLAMVLPDRLLRERVVLFSMAIFNTLFSIETVLDSVYLWGGMTLPDGMSYATYAHRGAYTLVAVAILAGGFVLRVMRSSRSVTDSRAIRNFIYVLLAQNIFLVISSMARLDSYVENYDLTYWRMDAFIFMVIVMMFIILIIVAIARQEKVSWFLKASCCVVFVSIYASSLVNFPRIIATYNIEHCREVSGHGMPLDLSYIIDLGADAVPVMDAYRSRFSDIYAQYENVINNRYYWPYDGSTISWRQWSIHDWRLSRYFNERGRH